MTNTTTKKTPAKKPRRMAREPKLETAAPQISTEPSSGANDGWATPPAGGAKPPTKSAVILGLLTRSQGATLGQLIEATGWLPHTTRAALTGLKKKGFEVTSVKIVGLRTYRVTNRLESDTPDERLAAETSDA
jgi:hypothetical protein